MIGTDLLFCFEDTVPVGWHSQCGQSFRWKLPPPPVAPQESEPLFFPSLPQPFFLLILQGAGSPRVWFHLSLSLGKGGGDYFFLCLEEESKARLQQYLASVEKGQKCLNKKNEQKTTLYLPPPSSLYPSDKSFSAFLKKWRCKISNYLPFPFFFSLSLCPL